MKILKRIKKAFRKSADYLKKFFGYFKTSKTAIRGAVYGILALAVLISLISDFQYFSTIGVFPVLVLSLMTLLFALLTGLLGNLLIKLTWKTPVMLRFAILVAIFLISFKMGMSMKTGMFLSAYVILFSALAGGAVWVLYRKGWRGSGLKRRIMVLTSGILGIAGLIVGTYWLVQPGKVHEMPEIAALKGDYQPEHLSVNDPGTKGNYTVMTLTYGSGNDKQREEFAGQAAIVTTPVDGSFFVDGWTGLTGKLRTRYFGFGLDSLPRNARVWYPQGKGPFPLALIVHGNHLAQDFSDPGYDYLGELLASRGIILASVDENFLNGSYTNLFKGLKTENDARGWMLLEHLKLWREWNADSSSLFYEKIDMENIALMGHSRGGEAVAHAALFNSLPYYPDNAKVAFDYDFSLKSIVAIAPADGQYQPAGIRTPLRDVSYFVIHGSHDADVQSFVGMRQYERVTFSENFKGFKSSLYVYNANHGQFNTSWGRRDYQRPRIDLINLKQLMPKEDQEKIAKTFISAFLEITLKDREELIPLFMDYRTGRNWLPETIFLNRFDQPDMQYIVRFDEDLDLTTTSLPGGIIETENLTVWREQMVKLKWGDKETRAAFIGWNNKENDSTTACYSITIPENSVRTDRNTGLFFSLADANENSNPNPKKKDSDTDQTDSLKLNEPSKPNHSENSKNTEPSNGDNEKEEKESKREPISFSIELAESNGETLRFQLSDHSWLQSQIKVNMPKLSFMRNAPDSEHLYQFFYFPMERLLKDNPKFSPDKIVRISLIFDQTEDGVIILDHLGFM
jgi:hypothetical protein